MAPLGDEEREIGRWLVRSIAEDARINWERSGYRVSVRKKERNGKDESSG